MRRAHGHARGDEQPDLSPEQLRGPIEVAPQEMLGFELLRQIAPDERRDQRSDTERDGASLEGGQQALAPMDLRDGKRVRIEEAGGREDLAHHKCRSLGQALRRAEELRERGRLGGGPGSNEPYPAARALAHGADRRGQLSGRAGREDPFGRLRLASERLQREVNGSARDRDDDTRDGHRRQSRTPGA